LWHGPSGGFVIWGLLHGMGLIAERTWRQLRRGADDAPGAAPAATRRASRAGHAIAWAATIGFCSVVRIFFRSEDLGTAWLYLSRLVRPSWALAGIDPLVVGITILCFALNLTGRTLFQRFVTACRCIPRPAQPVAWAALAIALLACRTREMTPYIYFGF